jgi:hypothetical protein
MRNRSRLRSRSRRRSLVRPTAQSRTLRETRRRQGRAETKREQAALEFFPQRHPSYMSCSVVSSAETGCGNSVNGSKLASTS